jgi:4-amino-4-deoxy-L-arabinose transferase-like glycosyltransferase
MRRRRARGLGRALGRVPRAGWLCALVACLNAICWSFITPPFQVPDEPDHYSYVEQLALTGTPPTSAASRESPSDEKLALEDLGTYRIYLRPETHAVFSKAEQQGLERDLSSAQSTPVKATGAAGVAAGEPPLYYVLELIPYELAGGGTVLDRLQLMRLASALLAGLTALFTFLFIREALPGARWAWAVGGMAIALAPMLGFMSGGVTPEAMLYAVSAAAFLCFARAFRHGLTARRAVLIGAVIAVGLLTKLNFLGFLPGMALGMAVLVSRLQRASRVKPYRAVGSFAAIFLAFAIAGLASVAASHFALGAPESTVRSVTRQGSIFDWANYLWQFYLPRLPGMPNDFPGILTTRQVWFDGLVGLFGWLDTTFPGWVYDAALLPAGALALLCLRALLTNRDRLRARSAEIATYAVMAAGLLVVIGSASYASFPQIGGAYAEGRYLLPLLAPMGAALALAARGAGRRWGPAVGVAMLVLFFAQDLFGQLQAIARYYG